VDPLSRRNLVRGGVGAAVGLSATNAPAAALVNEHKQLDPQLAACDVPEAAGLRERSLRSDFRIDAGLASGLGG
jgi:hypothetical protein